jgi:hypothetical protein
MYPNQMYQLVQNQQIGFYYAVCFFWFSLVVSVLSCWFIIVSIAARCSRRCTDAAAKLPVHEDADDVLSANALGASGSTSFIFSCLFIFHFSF